jgi:DNA-binding transcriptional regulator YdaS (Cro superfamily)
MRSKSRGLRKAIKASISLGPTTSGKRNLAIALGIAEQSINGWHKIPRMRIIAIERITGVSREDLAPDLYQ